MNAWWPPTRRSVPCVIASLLRVVWIGALACASPPAGESAPTPVAGLSALGPGLVVVNGEVRDCEARVTSQEACPGLAAFIRDSSRSVDTLPPERAIFFYGRRGREGALVITTPGQVTAPRVPVGADRDPLVIVDGQRLLCPLRVLDGRNSPSPTDSLPDHNCRGEKPLMAQDIVAVDVLKGPAPLRYFGPGAANGVIVIATKRLGITPRVRPDTSGLTGPHQVSSCRALTMNNEQSDA